jgi:hypothetical protein
MYKRIVFNDGHRGAHAHHLHNRRCGHHVFLFPQNKFHHFHHSTKGSRTSLKAIPSSSDMQFASKHLALPLTQLLDAVAYLCMCKRGMGCERGEELQIQLKLPIEVLLLTLF